MATGGLEDFEPSRLALLRKRAGMTRADIAVRCRVTLSTVRSWEVGRSIPSEANAVRVAEILDIHPADLTNTPRNQPTLKQLRQWRGLRGEDAANTAGIGTTPLYSAETYISPIPDHIRTSLAAAYGVTEKQITAAWRRGRKRRFGDIT
ncbi:helix-turn-helix transcriptional regulator [Gordonia sp. OPL2]|uniref:helix-turn-helix domain-containing protein n=1 Tax=Gordonia sp. OPL2 TaxID=2486274 RepID=UPI0021CC9E64|nr:helix-turn-helix transcriptional regulator [Gordonia sp. OPL2]